MRNKNAGKLMLLTIALAASVVLTACGADKIGADNANSDNTATENASKDSVNADGTSTENATVENGNAENAGTESESASGPDIFKTMDTVDMEGEKADASMFAENTLTFVNLWNVGCTPCVQEIPVLDQLNDEYEGKGVAIKGLYFSFTSTLSEEETEAINEILEAADADYQQLTLSEDMINHEVIQSIQAFPTTFVVDSEGNIVDVIIGSNDYEGWKERIEQELAEVSEGTVE